MNPLADLLGSVLDRRLPSISTSKIGKVDNKIIRDAVWGMIEVEAHEALLIDTPLFQRLRGIFQTGFTYLVYPCAVHSRFEHSLGCLHLAGRIVDRLRRGSCSQIDEAARVTVRLAALLHDITHCIFSHVSEPLYERDERVEGAKSEIAKLFHPDTPEIGAAEAVTFGLITSDRFAQFLDEMRCIVGKDKLPDEVSPTDIARLIVGLPPLKHQDRLFLAQIINGPFDADKLDYQARDGYFTGVTMPVDLDRLLASLCVGKRKNQQVLAVDHRGIAPLEQLLFNRMLLYDSVYHHHKIRAAVRLFRRAAERDKTLTLDWLLDHDEYDFIGQGKRSGALRELVARLRARDLPRRAVVIHPATVNDDTPEWRHRIAQYLAESDPFDREESQKWLDGIEESIKQELPSELRDSFCLDVPKPPKFQRIQNTTYVKLAENHLVNLDEIFKITSVLNSYAQQSKYRMYVFAERESELKVAAAAFKAFSFHGIHLNGEAFRLAKLRPEDVGIEAGETVPERKPMHGVLAP